MDRTSSALEVDSDVTWPRFPEIVHEVYQWKPKPKGKKQKSQIDDTRTEISYSANSAGDADFETSTYVSKDFGTSSSPSMDSKKGKKRSKKSMKEASGSVHSEGISTSPECTDVPKEEPKCASYLVTLDCPLCCDSDCILNKAAHCPLLRHNVSESNDACQFCNTNCQCAENKMKFLPVSGLVQRDDNGIAVTLLKANGGPIENSYEWANRRRWDVPSHVRWEHKISEWITVPLQEDTKAEEGGHKKRSHRAKNKRKSRITPSTTNVAPEVASNSEDVRTEEDTTETKLVLEGHGFKIFSNGHEKILINYDRRNCKYMGCGCVPDGEAANCGCQEGHLEGEKGPKKHSKHCHKGPAKISLVKETSHGMVAVQKELEAKYTKEKTKVIETQIVAKTSSSEKIEESTPKPPKLEPDKEEQPKTITEKDSQKKVNLKGLKGKDVRHASRAEYLETALRSLENLHKEEKEVKTDNTVADYVNVSCPATEMPPLGGNLGTCICISNCTNRTY